MFIFNWNPTEREVEGYLREMRKKLDECHEFLSQKRTAYEKFDRYETVSEDPYSFRARTLDSREDRYVLQFLKEIERRLPSSACQVHSIQELHSKWREVHNFWTDSWEALQRAEARADSAEREYNEMQSRQSKYSNALVSPMSSSGAVEFRGCPSITNFSKASLANGNNHNDGDNIEKKLSTEEVSDVDSTAGRDFRSVNSSRDFAEN